MGILLEGELRLGRKGDLCFVEDEAGQKVSWSRSQLFAALPQLDAMLADMAAEQGAQIANLLHTSERRERVEAAITRLEGGGH